MNIKFKHQTISLAIILVMALFSISCSDSPTSVVPTGNAFSLNVIVKDTQGNPVKWLNVGVCANIPPLTSAAPSNKTINKTMASSTTIEYQLPRDAKIIMTLYNLNNTLKQVLVNDLQSAGYHTCTYSVSDSLNKNQSGTAIYKCILRASSLKDSVFFVDSIYIMLHQPSPSLALLGLTDSKGEISTSDSLAFPNLFNLPPIVRTGPNSSDPIGTFNLQDSSVICLSDASYNKYMTFTKKISTKSNQFYFVWSPTLSQTSANKYIALGIIKDTIFPCTAELYNFTATSSAGTCWKAHW